MSLFPQSSEDEFVPSRKLDLVPGDWLRPSGLEGNSYLLMQSISSGNFSEVHFARAFDVVGPGDGSCNGEEPSTIVALKVNVPERAPAGAGAGPGTHAELEGAFHSRLEAYVRTQPSDRIYHVVRTIGRGVEFCKHPRRDGVVLPVIAFVPWGYDFDTMMYFVAKSGTASWFSWQDIFRVSAGPVVESDLDNQVVPVA